MNEMVLKGKNVGLRPLAMADATDDYLSWLSDPEVLNYSGRRGSTSTREQMESYIAGIAERGDVVMAVCEIATSRHIGNVTLNTIQPKHGSAELSIMIGARDVWGKGYGKEAIALLTRHGFEALGLHRIWAESPNPAFNAAVKALGWAHEGTKREAFRMDGDYVDFECWSILADEFAKGAGR
ncbi:MAG: GNAT family N-acetyltransferase [Rhodospirillales bacterium]|nr:GNAT family N-acetyltransferase [Rhodospirillales bacterium]